MFDAPPGRNAPAFLVSTLPSLAILAASILLTGCIAGQADDVGPDTLLVSEQATENGAYSMAIPSIDEIIDEAAETDLAAVVVPSDRALLALDADRLAELAGDGDLESLIVVLPSTELIDLASPAALKGAEVIIIDVEGDAFRLGNDGPTPTFADQPIRAVERRGTVTVIAVDGIVER